MKKPILIVGAGGFAREAYSWLPSTYQVEAFYTSNFLEKTTVFGVPTVSEFQGMRGIDFLVAIGDPAVRKSMFFRAVKAGLMPCAPIVHQSATIGRDVRVGRGSIICPQAVITTNVVLGTGALVNLGATIGHDCEIGDFVTLSPGANVSGNVRVSDLCYLGTNCSIRENTHLGRESTVAMGSAVVKHVDPHTTVAGVPARLLKRFG